MSNKVLPKWLVSKILSAFHGHEMLMRPGWFVIWYDKAQIKLVELFGVCIGEQPEYTYTEFKLRFDWNLQKFVVSA